MDVGKAIDDVVTKRDQAWEEFARAANRHGYRTGLFAGFFGGAFMACVIFIAMIWMHETSMEIACKN